MNVIERIESGELYLMRKFRGGDGYEYHTKIDTDKASAELLALAKQGEKMRWIPVGESLPKEGQVVDVIYRYSNDNRQYRATGVVYDCFKQFGMYSNVTHWMPLPEPPKEGEADDGR